MYRAAEYQPNWVSPPGNTISELLKMKGIGIADFAGMIVRRQVSWDKLVVLNRGGFLVHRVRGQIN